MAKKRFPQDLVFEAKHIRFEFRYWHDTGMVCTLGDLRRLLREVEDEMSCFDGEALIVDYWDDLGITTDYVSLFGDPDDHDDDVPLTFDYRLANVEEDLMHVEQLIEGLGESFKFTDLPKPKYMKKKPKAA